MEKERPKGTEKNKREKMKFHRKSGKQYSGILSIVAILIVAVITFGGNIVEAIPNWDDILTSIGVYEKPQDVTGKAVVDFLDVGQGDCSVIRSGNCTVVIDTGDTNAGKTITDFLQKNKIKTIDKLVLTHPHADHIGSAIKIIEEFNVKEVMMGDVPDKIVPTTSLYTNLLKTIEREKVKTTITKVGDKFAVGEGMAYVISPAKKYESLNNTSLVIRYVFGETAFLFAADMESKAENDLVNSGVDLSCDVLKVGHHGSSTSTGKKLLTYISPKYSVISCGENNREGFPNDDVMKRLYTYTGNPMITHQTGNIRFITDGKNIDLKTEKQL